MVNDFFDCTNVRSESEHVRKRNERIKPYTSCDDEHLVWMKAIFLKFLDDWKASIQVREGPFHQLNKRRCFCPTRHIKDSRYQ